MTSAGVPSVSIVVPAYNHARHLPQALDSLLSQDHPDLEIIVLDDGSTDATPDVLQGYTGRLHWERQANMGQAATLNRGWRMARGDLLGYLSADDLLDPTAVSTVAAVLSADPDAVLAYPDYRLVDVHGDVIKHVRAPDFDYRQVLADCHCPPGPGALFRRDAGAAAGFWDADLSLIPDYAFWLRLGLYGRCRRVPHVLAAYRVHEGSQTFAAVAPDRSEEYVRVTKDFYARPDVPMAAIEVRKRALSSAYLMSARSHLRSARYGSCRRRAVSALRLDPSNLRPHTLRVFGHGLFAHRRSGARTGPPAGTLGGRIVTGIFATAARTGRDVMPNAEIRSVVHAQDVGHGERWDYDPGSPHLRHPGLRGRIERQLDQLVSEQIRMRGSCRVLEIGAGHGTFTDRILTSGAEVTVTEASRASATRLQNKYRENPRVTVLHDRSGEDVLGLAGPWDMVVVVSVLHHIPDYLGFVSSLVEHIRAGGCFYSVQDPLWYPRMRKLEHRAHFAAYFAWRLFQGDFRQGLATRWRRLRGTYDETKPSDLIEYHVVRQGVDEQALSRMLGARFDRVDLFTYWSSQGPLLHALGEKTAMRTNFGISASGCRGPA